MFHGQTSDEVHPGKDWERKQRAREYRVAARREKRNRKADEKKQRKLNATILRRMVSAAQSREVFDHGLIVW